MSGTVIDHFVSVTVFLGAILIFISLFNQTLQTAVLYQQHRNIAMKCSDLLDNVLLTPGIPAAWGRSNGSPIGFGLQDPELKQYNLSPFSLMRLNSSLGEPVYYSKTGLYYSNITVGFGESLLVQSTQLINYSTAETLLGINNKFGFQLTITPIVIVSITETQSDPLQLEVNVAGMGFPLSNATVSYCFLKVEGTGGEGSYPAYTLEYGDAYTNDYGSALLNFTDINGEEDSYSLIAYARISGLMGVGYHQKVSHDKNYVVPFIENFEEGKILIAHSYDVHGGDSPAEIAYNATFVIMSEDFTLREMPMENSTGKVGKINYGEGKPYKEITIPTHNPGILIISYRKSAVECGVVAMPWGINSLAFPTSFGHTPLEKEWVATDIRHVIVNDIAYQVKLALWSLEGYQVRV